jgi:hypothetical protein
VILPDTSHSLSRVASVPSDETLLSSPTSALAESALFSDNAPMRRIFGRFHVYRGRLEVEPWSWWRSHLCVAATEQSLKTRSAVERRSRTPVLKLPAPPLPSRLYQALRKGEDIVGGRRDGRDEGKDTSVRSVGTGWPPSTKNVVLTGGDRYVWCGICSAACNDVTKRIRASTRRWPIFVPAPRPFQCGGTWEVYWMSETSRLGYHTRTGKDTHGCA